MKIRWPFLEEFFQRRISMKTFCLFEAGLLGSTLAVPQFAPEWDDPVASRPTAAVTTTVGLTAPLNGIVVRLDEGDVSTRPLETAPAARSMAVIPARELPAEHLHHH